MWSVRLIGQQELKKLTHNIPIREKGESILCADTSIKPRAGKGGVANYKHLGVRALLQTRVSPGVLVVYFFWHFVTIGVKE